MSSKRTSRRSAAFQNPFISTPACLARRSVRFVAPVVSLLAFAPSPVLSHDAPAGWSYPFSCCSGMDCREVAGNSIAERPEGYVIKGTGEVLGYRDTRLKVSPDGEYHWCSVAGADNTRTICLFVPPKAY